MKNFKSIVSLAEKRKGGKELLQELLPKFLSKAKLAQKGDDRFLAMMTKAVNQAGFKWSVINNKWAQFEEAYYNFDIKKLSLLKPKDWQKYREDTRVVRNWQKIEATMKNLHLINSISKDYGSFAKFIANWSESDQIGLMDFLKQNGSRLGGYTAQWFLRYIGKDCFITTPDVIEAVKYTGREITKGTSKKDLKIIQEAFNDWHSESGLPYSHLSKIAAYSTGKNYDIESIKKEMKKQKDN
ncbi:MAG: DNA-3-methyladenine glycosylase I [Candidatus Caenarcaniphilales bacterium]|nr:DNA-3-methyladenine glycosylase I [Candidatus Caenarcaniphilales bacterium]